MRSSDCALHNKQQPSLRHQPDAQFHICDKEWHRKVLLVGIWGRERRSAGGKAAFAVSRLPNTLSVSLLRLSSLTQPQSRCHTPQHCFYFRYSPLLPSQSPCIDTLYRWLRWINVISVHIYALNAILGGADKLRVASLPLVSDRLLPSWRTAPLPRPPITRTHKYWYFCLCKDTPFQNTSQTFLEQQLRLTLTWNLKTIFTLIFRCTCMLVAQLWLK